MGNSSIKFVSEVRSFAEAFPIQLMIQHIRLIFFFVCLEIRWIPVRFGCRRRLAYWIWAKHNGRGLHLMQIVMCTIFESYTFRLAPKVRDLCDEWTLFLLEKTLGHIRNLPNFRVLHFILKSWNLNYILWSLGEFRLDILNVSLNVCVAANIFWLMVLVHLVHIYSIKAMSQFWAKRKLPVTLYWNESHWFIVSWNSHTHKYVFCDDFYLIFLFRFELFYLCTLRHIIEFQNANKLKWAQTNKWRWVNDWI